MFHFSHRSSIRIALVASGLTAGAIAVSIFTTPGVAAPDTTTAFPDTQNHWAQPFIKNLAERNIVAGYLDGTFRPDRPVDRDEFAAILSKAFNQKSERNIASGSVYKDVPQGYWAAPAIEAAYQQGFMQGYPGGYFRPRQEVTRVETLVALAQNLNLGGKQAAIAQATRAQVNNTPQQNALATPARRQVRRKRFMYPMAMTTLMQPLVTPRVNTVNLPAQSVPQAAVPATTPSQNPPSQTQKSASEVISNYYKDADQIPQYAVDEVANATKAGIVVNYPNLNVLNPTRPATRGEIAAIIHQVLVDQGRIEPLSNQTEAANYIVKRE